MPYGATVRRLHRERQERLTARRTLHRLERRDRAAPNLTQCLVALPNHAARPETLVALASARAVEARTAPESDGQCPLHVIELLSTWSGGETAVIGAKVFELRRRPKTAGLGRGFSARPLADIADRLQYLADRSAARLEAWATGHGGGYPELDRYLPPPSPSTAAEISGFISGKLAPRLSALNGSVNIVEEREATHPAAKVGERFVYELRSDFALVGDTLYRLAPFYGTAADHELYLETSMGPFVGMRAEHRQAALDRYQRKLVDVLRGAFSTRSRTKELYRSGDYYVLITPRGRFYFCRHCPPYVVEASDGRLYYFDAAQIGMQLTHLCSRVLIRDHVVQALHPYAHMFVQNAFGGRIVCMPRTQEYYDRLRAMPPEDALTEHLESA